MFYGGLDILFVVLLISLNGMLAMSEIAIISARKPRLQQRAEEGDAKARSALDLANSPGPFLSSVQIGITLVGILSGAFGGATISHKLAAVLSRFPSLAPYSETIALSVVVLLIAYFSLLAELVPKRLALNDAERIASVVAAPMRSFARITSPVIRLMTASTDLVLRLVRSRPSAEPPVTEEEIKVMINQARVAGVIEEVEQDMVERVFRLGDKRVGALMTPRKKIVWLDVNDSADRTRRKIMKSVYSRFPVSQGRLGNIQGVVHVRALLERNLQGQAFNLRATLQQPLFVLENTHLLQVMELFREAGTQMALVIDEYGTIEGLVTLNDILEAIIGDIPSSDQLEAPKVVQREDGSWLVDGMFPVDELKDLFHIKKLPGEGVGQYQTLGGFVMSHLGRIPSASDHFECCGLRFEVMDMDGHRVDKVLVVELEKDLSDEGNAPDA
jgi:putative hemolysin